MSGEPGTQQPGALLLHRRREAKIGGAGYRLPSPAWRQPEKGGLIWLDKHAVSIYSKVKKRFGFFRSDGEPHSWIYGEEVNYSAPEV